MRLISIAFTAIIILAYKYKYYEGEPPEIKNAITIYRNVRNGDSEYDFVLFTPEVELYSMYDDARLGKQCI
jgi:hypothetical protein